MTHERRIAGLEATKQDAAVCTERYARVMDAIDGLRDETKNLRREAMNYRRQRSVQTIGILAAFATSLVLLLLRLLTSS